MLVQKTLNFTSAIDKPPFSVLYEMLMLDCENAAGRVPPPDISVICSIFACLTFPLKRLFKVT